jgi:TRAP-type transport system periplasmic protein
MNRLLLCLAAVSLAAAPVRAQEVKIKLGTVAPQGSTWHTLLTEMGQRWSDVSGGKVVLKVYAGGTQGSEGEMVRKLSIGQLHAAAMTTVGLRDITPEPQAEDTPGLIDSYEEYEYVHQRMRPELEAALARKGYVVLNWGEAGFVNVFSTEPYKAPGDFAAGKIFAWNGDPASEEAWKAAGFRPVVLSSTDLITSLQTKMINIVAQPPLYAYTAGLFERAKYMLDLKWGLLTGATVVKKDQWEKIPADLRVKLLAIAEEYGAKVVADVRKQNEEAVAQMVKKGLTVVEPTDLPGWKAALARAQEIVRTKVVPTATYDKVKALRDEYRALKHEGREKK